uniref:Uncharacterized protein n=1 Tax=Nicotiana tabacum TaxID=4097 RepID=A0A1S4C463_TOBAC
MKWRLTSRVLCDKNVSLKLKGMIYKAVVRPTMMYEAECWLIKNFHVQKMKVTEMRMLRCMCHHTRLNKIMNEVIRYKVGVAPMEDKMREARLRWFRHVNRRSTKAHFSLAEDLSEITSLPSRVGIKLRTFYPPQTPLPHLWEFAEFVAVVVAQQLAIAQLQSHPRTPSTAALETAPPAEQVPERSSNNG